MFSGPNPPWHFNTNGISSQTTVLVIIWMRHLASPPSLPKCCTTFQAALVVWEGFTPGYRQYHLEDLPSPCIIGELKRQDQEPASNLGVGPTAAEAHNPTTTETATSRIRAPVSHVASTQPSARPARLTTRNEWNSPCSTYPLQSRRRLSKRAYPSFSQPYPPTLSPISSRITRVRLASRRWTTVLEATRNMSTTI